MKKFIFWIRKHLVISALIVALIGGGVWWYRSKNTAAAPPQYLTAAVERGTLSTSISGSGQVSASSQIDLKPEVSGKVISVSVHNGDAVTQGQLLAQLDSGDAYKSVRDAQISLQSAQLSLKKLQQPADTLSVTQAQNSLASAQESLASATADLAKDYDTAFNSISNAFLDLPSVMSGLNDVLYSSTMGTVQWNVSYYSDAIDQYDLRATPLQKELEDGYNAARTTYDANFSAYKAAGRFSSRSSTLMLLDQTYQTAKTIADVLKNATDFIQLYVDTMTQHSIRVNTQANTHLNSLASYNSKINSTLSSLLSARQAIDSDNQTINTAQRTITERQQSLDKLNAGTDALDLESAQLSVRQRQIALADAQQNYAKYALRAPIAGTIAAVSLVKGDQAGSGTSAVTIVSPQQLAEITLNEVDVAKVKLGQKATLSFDAIEGLTLTGTVADIDGIGAVSQGVVSYGVKIVFDTTDPQIKPGMSVSAAIITSVKQDVLMVPTSAVSGATVGQTATVQVMQNGVPTPRVVTVGVSNDTNSEVSGNIAEGEEVVTQVIQPTTSSNQTRTTGGTSGLPFIGGGNVRVINGGGGGGTFRTGR